MFKFECCTNDNSLLFYNYSNTSCSNNAIENKIRISDYYNNSCFNIDNNYNLYLQWTCGDYVNCDGIPFFDGLFDFDFDFDLIA